MGIALVLDPGINPSNGSIKLSDFTKKNTTVIISDMYNIRKQLQSSRIDSDVKILIASKINILDVK